MDDITLEEFQEIYSKLEYDELLSLNSEELTLNAQKALSEELNKREVLKSETHIETHIKRNLEKEQKLDVDKKYDRKKFTNLETKSEIESSKITTCFNVAITIIYFFTLAIHDAFFKPSNQKMRIDSLFDADPLIGFLILALFGILSIIVSLVIIKKIWENLFMDIFNVRNINYAEAYAFIMFFAFLL